MNFFSRMARNRHTQNRGFTLMELVVSLGIFSAVVVAAVGMMISVFRAQSKAIAIKNVFDNARFSLELMTRELRTGDNIRLTTTFPFGCPSNGLAFTSYNRIGAAQERFYYYADSNGDGTDDALMRVAMPTAGSIDCTAVAPQQFTSPEVVVDKMYISTQGLATGSADGQPRLTLGFTMHSSVSQLGQETSIAVQTTIVPRIRDIAL